MGDLFHTEEERDIISGKLAALEQALQGMASHASGLQSLLSITGEPAIFVLEALQMVRCFFIPSEIMMGLFGL
jgi:hypothetical protein